MTEHGGEFVTARNVGEQTTRREFQLGRFGPFTFGLFRDGRVADVCREFELTNVTETAKRLDPDELSNTELTDSVGRFPGSQCSLVMVLVLKEPQMMFPNDSERLC